MSDEPRFVVCPPLRCFHVEELPEPRVCGALAHVVRPASTLWPGGYFCREHAQRGDRLLTSGLPFRLVSVTLEVLLAGTSWAASQAQAEAVTQLERAVCATHGVINLQACRSLMGRPAASGETRRGAGVAVLPDGR